MGSIFKVFHEDYTDIVWLLSILQVFHAKDKQQSLHLQSAFILT